MKDIFGQEIKPGCRVVWIGGKTKYAGARVYEVVSINKYVTVYDDKDEIKKSTHPNNVVVVDKLINEPVAEC